MRWVPFVLAGLLLVPTLPLTPFASGQETRQLSENVQTNAVAVARTESGETTGTTATISVTVSSNGTGGVFLDTRPLTGTDMQGSARIAARVASSTTGYDLAEHDFYFVVRSESPVISGPSAGSVMALAATTALEKLHRNPGEEAWDLSDEVLVTGTINPDGSIGPVGGIAEKARAAAGAGATLFLAPEGQGQVEVGGEVVPVGEYCEERLGITCREVGQLTELVEQATGHRFVEPELGEPPTTEPYEDTLAPLADRLVDRGRLYEEVWDRLNASDVEQGAAREITRVLQGAQDGVQRALANADEGRHYSAASRAFTAAIQARHADLLLRYHERNQAPGIVESAISNASRAAEDAREAAGEANVTGMQDLYTVGAAQKRVSEAEQRVQEARQAWNDSQGAQPATALLESARAVERAQTVHWWLSLGDAFGPGPQLEVTAEQLADEMLNLADEMLAYTSQVLGGQQPDEAARTLQAAHDDANRGFHAGAAIEAAEVQVIAALTLELRTGTVSEEKLNASRNQAVQAIQKARALNVEPILPIALFEFGSVQENAGASIRFYRTARVLAGLSETLEVTSEPAPTEFVGGWEAEDHAEPVGHSYQAVAVGWFAVGVFATLVLLLFGLALAGPRGRS